MDCPTCKTTLLITDRHAAADDTRWHRVSDDDDRDRFRRRPGAT